MWHFSAASAPNHCFSRLADVGVRLAGLLRRGVAAGADGPDRLVGDHQVGHLLGREAVEAGLHLPIEDLERLFAFALLERLADADDRARARAWMAASGLAVDDLVGVAEHPAPLGVADDDEFGARLLEHRRADLAGEGAFLLPVARPVRRRRRCVLRDASATACSAVNGGATTISTSSRSFTSAAELLGVGDGLVHRLEHLPVGGEKRRARHGHRASSFVLRQARRRYFLSGSAATPGRVGRRGTRATRRRPWRCG